MPPSPTQAPTAMIKRLEKRISPSECKEILLFYFKNDAEYSVDTLLLLTEHPQTRISENAARLCAHLSLLSPETISPHFDALCETLLRSHDTTQIRLLLSSLYNTACRKPPLRLNSTALKCYDFCLSHLLSPVTPSISALCTKLAEVLTRDSPELRQELLSTLELLDENRLSPALKAARRNTLKKITSQRPSSRPHPH